MTKKECKAPIIFTNKDLDYLKDMFGWNYTIYKYGINIIDYLTDEKIKKMIMNCSNFSNNNMQQIINILGDDINE